MPVFLTSCGLCHGIVAFLIKKRGNKSNWINYRHFETLNSSSFLGLFETPSFYAWTLLGFRALLLNPRAGKMKEILCSDWQLKWANQPINQACLMKIAGHWPRKKRVWPISSHLDRMLVNNASSFITIIIIRTLWTSFPERHFILL